MHTRSTARRLLLALVAAVTVAAGRPTSADTFAISLFEQYVESLRRAAGLPGVSALILQGGQIVWERGFGFQDVENRIAARPDTPYAIGGLTEALAATVLLQCVERGTLDLDAPMTEFSNKVATPGARVRHVLTHTSEAVPGERFKYDPERFAALVEVSNRCSGFAFRKVLVFDIIRKLAMVDSVPGADVLDRAVIPEGTFDEQWEERFARALRQMAVPYRVNKKGEATRSELSPKSIDTSTGVISTVRDLASYDLALTDRALLLTPESLSLAWTNPQSSSGVALPHGLGWFVQFYEGKKVVWQFGVVDAGYSSLMIKIPSRDVTLIMLANSDGLVGSPAQISTGDLTASPFARVFLKLFP